MSNLQNERLPTRHYALLMCLWHESHCEAMTWPDEPRDIDALQTVPSASAQSCVRKERQRIAMDRDEDLLELLYP